MKLFRYKLIRSFFVICILSLSFANITFAAVNAEGIQIYQKNMHLSQEHKRKLAADIFRYNNADNLWDELRQEFILPHYEDSYQVQEQIVWFLNHQDFLMRSTERAAPYLYYILQQIRKRHLPAECVLLPIIESAYNPFAYSSVGAAGIWQMMPGTASGFGIKQNGWYDGRRDIVASTKAALDYLAYLANFFEGNWLLSIAAYDTGEGNVLSAIRRNVQEGKNTDYWSLPLAQETRIYIPRLLALATIISHPEIYPINFPPVRNAPYLAQIDIGSEINLKRAADLAGISLKKLIQLNPGYKNSTIGPFGPFKLVLPIEHVEQFTVNLARSPLFQINWIHYKIKAHDTLASIAKKFNISVRTLRHANPKLVANLKPGKYLNLPKPKPDISKTILESQPKYIVSNDITQNMSKQTLAEKVNRSLENFRGTYKLQPDDTLYMVRNNDTIQKIAKKFHVTERTILTVNQLNSDNKISSGDQLIIPSHLNKPRTQENQLTSSEQIYQVKHGDTVDVIAKKFHTSAAAIRLANLLTSNNLQEGDQLVIPVHIG